MKYLFNKDEVPDYIIKSTLKVNFVSILVIFPFGINDFVQGRYLIGALILVVICLCVANVWMGLNDKYHEGINILGIVPAIILTISFATYELGVVGSYWAFLGVLSLYFILPEKRAWVANLIFLIIIVPVAWHSLDQAEAVRFIAVISGTSLFASLSVHEISKQNYLLKKLATTDSLTGLYNRTLLQSSLERAIHQSSRTNTAMSLIMLDIDHFKKINDVYGHDVGDRVLALMGEFLRHHFRGSDMVFRIGGEEFLVLVYNTDKRKALGVAEKLRAEVERLELIPDYTVTVSGGVSNFFDGDSWKQWMKQCDENLYIAKASGRNQVIA